MCVKRPNKAFLKISRIRSRTAIRAPLARSWKPDYRKSAPFARPAGRGLDCRRLRNIRTGSCVNTSSGRLAVSPLLGGAALRTPRRMPGSHLLPLLVICAALATGCATAATTTTESAPATPGDARAEAPVAAALAADDTGREPASLGENPRLSDYLAFAAANSPALQSSGHEVKAAREKSRQAGFLPDPHLMYAYNFRKASGRADSERQGWGLSQMLPWFGTLGLERSAATAAAEAAESRYEVAVWSLAYEVSSAYYEYWYLARSVETVEGFVEITRQTEAVLRKDYEAGTAPYAVLIRSEMELGQLDDRLRSLVDMRPAASSKLAAAVGLPPSALLPWPPADDIDEAPLQEMPPDALAAESPQVRVLQRQVEMRSADLLLARRRFYPDITVGVELGSAMMAGMPEGPKDPVVGTLSMSLPLYRSSYRAAESAAREVRLASLRRKEDVSRRISAELAMAFFGYRDAVRKTDLYGSGLVPKARQSFEASLASFRAGESALTDVLDSLRVWLEFSLDCESSRADRAVKAAECEMLAGRALRANVGADAAGGSLETSFWAKGEEQ